MLTTGLAKGSRPSLNHSKFRIKTSRDLAGCLYASEPQRPTVEFDQVLNNENALQISAVQKSYLKETKLNTLTDLKSTAGNPFVKSVKQSEADQCVGSKIESFRKLENDEAKSLKHHLEQVFIIPPFSKKD